MYQVSPMNWILIFFMVLFFFLYLTFSILMMENKLFFSKFMKKIYVK